MKKPGQKRKKSWTLFSPFTQANPNVADSHMNPKIQSYIDRLTSDFSSIHEERKHILAKIAEYIILKHEKELPVNLVFICTHNSRRSHYGQIWGNVAALHYGINGVRTYSGGTEATAFHPNAIQALQRAGFQIQKKSEEGNPLYHVFHDEASAPDSCFSKTYDHPVNPREHFAAIMTCSDAEENCPFIPGVELRIATTYEDPKLYDNTALQEEKYDERCRQIAHEMLYVFSLIKKENNRY